MSIDLTKELESFQKSCNGRFKPAFDKGFNDLHERFNDGSLNKRWRGWLQHAHWSDLEMRNPNRANAESPEQEGARLFAAGVPAAKVYGRVSELNMFKLERVMDAYKAAELEAEKINAEQPEDEKS